MPVLLSIWMLTSILHSEFSNPEGKHEKEIGNYFFAYTKAKDTIYFLGNNYIEINLKTQKATLFHRKDSARVYKISSGTSTITDGLETPDGIYTVQSKSPLAISKQFNDAELYHWIGFNGNVGFHGLKGTGYYRTLGLRPSSHGCVRIGREDGEDLYGRVILGTPVVVFHNEPAFYFKFASINEYNPEFDFLLEKSSPSFKKLMKMRMQNIYKGMALRHNKGKVFLDGKSVLRPGGFEIGEMSLIPAYQKLPLNLQVRKILRDNLITHQYPKEWYKTLVKAKNKKIQKDTLNPATKKPTPKVKK